MIKDSNKFNNQNMLQMKVFLPFHMFLSECIIILYYHTIIGEWGKNYNLVDKTKVNKKKATGSASYLAKGWGRWWGDAGQKKD